MKLDYLDMLSGDPIYVEGVGHIRSPKLRELSPSQTGHMKYNMYISFLIWEKEDLIKYDKLCGLRSADRLNNEKLTTFDVVTLVESTKALCCEAMSFFMCEDLRWDEDNRRFCTFSRDGSETQIGVVDNANFEEVRSAMLKMNYVTLDRDKAPVKCANERTLKKWEKVQQYLADQAKNSSSKDDPRYHIGNIVSKLCCAHSSYNLLNVFDLTVFQIYDAFFQYGFLRASSLSENIFSNHGGDKFKFEDWLKPITHDS